MAADIYRELAEAAWRWVLDQVRDDDGPWLPTSPGVDAPRSDRDGYHSGIGGLAYLLAEIRLTRPWTDRETELAGAMAERLRRAIPVTEDYTFFDGLASTIGALVALDAPGPDEAVDRLLSLAQDDGWEPHIFDLPGDPERRYPDATLGTAGILLAAIWAHRHGVARAGELAGRAAEVLLAEAEPVPAGLRWVFLPERFPTERRHEMPNWSHGVAGVAGALAVAGAELDRPDLVDAARRGADYLVSLADTTDGGCRVHRWIPEIAAYPDPYSYGWCHGPAGTSLMFLALDHAGVRDVSGESPQSWSRRCLRSVVRSGIPQRQYPGFWDNDGRCCGTAGVADVFLDAWVRSGETADLEFAVTLADTLRANAIREGEHAHWRFVEHRADEPLLPPGTGWMQGAAGIAAVLFRTARVLDGPDPRQSVPRMDSWWSVPPAVGRSDSPMLGAERE